MQLPQVFWPITITTAAVCGLEKDVERAMELWTEAAEQGSIDAHDQLGSMYYFGDDSVEQDVARAVEHCKHNAATRDMFRAGTFSVLFVESVFILGVVAIAMKQHFSISIKMGYKQSLD